MTATQFAGKIDLLNTRFAFSVTSWFRSTNRNKLVGGHANSLHLVGLAVDIIVDNPAQAQELTSFAHQLGLLAIVEKDHVHVQAT